jgi:predicted dinucleotide-binding enzyme
LAAAGTVAEVAQAKVVFLAVPWAAIGQALHGLPNWEGRIVVDASNPILADGTFMDLGGQRASSWRPSCRAPGWVKAFKSLLVAWMADEPKQQAGKRVMFVSGDEADVKHIVKRLISLWDLLPSTWGASGRRPATTSGQATSRPQFIAY